MPGIAEWGELWRRGAGSLVAVVTVACAPVPDPSAGLTVDESVKLIDQAPHSPLTPEAVAEVFAIGSRSTDVQRDDMTKALVGHSIDWTVSVYEVSSAGGRYQVTSQPIPIKTSDAAALTTIVAYVSPRSDADEALLRTVKSDESLRLRGIVQEIRLRSIVVVVPAVAGEP